MNLSHYRDKYYEEAAEELIKAAKRAAKSGSRQDLWAYMKLRKKVAEKDRS